MRRWAHSMLTACLTLFRDADSLSTFFCHCLLSACVSLVSRLMDETKAGGEVAVHRHRPQVWTGVWVHCHAGMGAVPGAQLRGVALTHIYTQPPGLCWNTESLGSRETWAGWGFSANLISLCRNFEQGTLRKKKKSECLEQEVRRWQRANSKAFEFFSQVWALCVCFYA